MADLEAELDHLNAEYQLQELTSAVEELDDTGSNIFSILGIKTRERRLTRFLEWLLDPNATHNSGRSFLNAFLDASELEIHEPITIDSLVSISTNRDSDDAELDIVITGHRSAIGIEIKTTHQDTTEKLDKEATALSEKYPGYEAYDLVYLTYFGDRIPETDYRHVYWSDLIDQVEPELDAVPNDYERKLISDFIQTIRTNIMTEFDGISDRTELYLKHQDVIESVQKAYESDRDRVFEALEEAFFSLADCQRENWKTANRSDRYIKFYKPHWRNRNGADFEYEPHVRLRTDDPEIRLRLDIEGSGKEADRETFRSRLDDEEQALIDEGWEFTDGTYSFLRKNVPLALHDGAQDSVLTAMKELHAFREIVEPHIEAVVAEADEN